MSEISKSEKTIKELFVGNCWSYLHDNFHKFNETNKIKIALELCKKSLPTVMEGGLSFSQMPTVKLGGKEQELNIGNGASTDAGNTEQADSVPDTNQ